MSTRASVKIASTTRKQVKRLMRQLRIALDREDLDRADRIRKQLNALERAARRHAARASGVRNRRVDEPLGNEAFRAIVRGDRQATASVLGRYSEAVMGASRATQIEGEWTWTANESACAACLLEHGTRHTGEFAPLHPSCLCGPESGDSPSRPLTNEEIGSLLQKRGGRDARLGKLLEQGKVDRSDLVIRVDGFHIQRNKNLPRLLSQGRAS